MSTWYEIKKEDLEIDGDEINVYLETISERDDGGNVYAVIKIKDLEELLFKKIEFKDLPNHIVDCLEKNKK